MSTILRLCLVSLSEQTALTRTRGLLFKINNDIGQRFVKILNVNITNMLLLSVGKCQNILQCKRFSHFSNKK